MAPIRKSKVSHYIVDSYREVLNFEAILSPTQSTHGTRLSIPLLNYFPSEFRSSLCSEVSVRSTWVQDESSHAGKVIYRLKTFTLYFIESSEEFRR